MRQISLGFGVDNDKSMRPLKIPANAASRHRHQILGGAGADGDLHQRTMAQVRRGKLGADVVGACALSKRIGDRNDLRHANLTAGNIVDFHIVTDANLGEPLRHLEINPASRIEAGQGSQHLAKPHEISEPLRVYAQRALEWCAKGHPAQSRVQHRDLRFQRQAARFQYVQLILGDERVCLKRAITLELGADQIEIRLKRFALCFQIVIEQHQYGSALWHDLAALIGQLNHTACHLRRDHQMLWGAHSAAEQASGFPCTGFCLGDGDRLRGWREALHQRHGLRNLQKLDPGQCGRDQHAGGAGDQPGSPPHRLTSRDTADR